MTDSSGMPSPPALRATSPIKGEVGVLPTRRDARAFTSPRWGGRREATGGAILPGTAAP